MKTQKTHLMALRMAARVTVMSRGVRRACVGTAVGAALALSPVGCTSSSSSSAASGVADTVVADSSASGGSDSTGSVGADTTDESDAPDTSVSVSDTTALPDSGPVDEPDGWVADAHSADTAEESDTGAPDAWTPDIESQDTASEDLDVSVADADVEIGVPDESCRVPTGETCVDLDDCAEEGKGQIPCVDGLCYETDLTPNELAAACCQDAYAEGDVPAGCTPWGPPAPPRDRGLRLNDILGRTA